MGFDYSRLNKLKKHELYNESKEENNNILFPTIEENNTTNTPVIGSILLNKDKTININTSTDNKNMVNKSQLISENAIKKTNNNEQQSNKFKLEQLQNKLQQQSQERANKINQDISNGNYASAIGHILKGVPQKALDATTTTFASANSIIAPKTYRNNVNENELLKTNRKLSKQYEETTNQIDNDIVKTASGVSGTIGQMIPSIISNIALPGTGTVVQGVNVGAEAYQDTLNEDATNKAQATTTGVLKGVASALIEKISGGNLIGKGSLDDKAASIIEKTFKGKAGQKLASKAYEILGEIGEENVENQVGYVIDKLVNNKDMPDAKEWWNELGETTKSTFLTTLVLNLLGMGGSTYNDVQDIKTQKYVDEAKKIIARDLNKNTNLDIDTKINKLNEVNSIKDIKDLNNYKAGEQKNTLVKQLNKDTNLDIDSKIDLLNNLRKVNDSESFYNFLRKNNEQLKNMQSYQSIEQNNLQGQQSISQSNKMAQNQTSTQINDLMNNKTAPLPKLQYQETDNEFVNNMYKSAIENNFNDSQKTHDFLKPLEQIIRDKNLQIRFDSNLKDSNGNIANGSYSNGVITINPNSTRAGEFIAIHELTHAIGTKEMLNIINNYRNSNAEFDSAVQELLKNYDATEISEEAMSDIAGQLFGNQEFINNLAQNNPSMFRQIYNEIKYLWHQFTGYKNQNQFIEDLQYKWEQAYRNSIKLNNTKKYSLAGENSKTANRKALDEAIKMKQTNATDEEIFQKTGWYLGGEGKWKYEINDRGFKVKDDLKKNGSYWLEDVFNAKELYDAYPKLRFIPVDFMNLAEDIAGGYDTLEDKIVLSNDLLELDSTEKKKAILHEIQHAIQNIEDFAEGANSTKWAERKNELINSIEQVDKEIQDLQNKIGIDSFRNNLINKMTQNENINYWDEIEKFENNSKYANEFNDLHKRKEKYIQEYSKIRNRDNFELYTNTAGEQEAFDVENRSTYTDEQRKNTLPLVKNDNTVYIRSDISMKEGASNANDERNIYKEHIMEHKGNDNTRDDRLSSKNSNKQEGEKVSRNSQQEETFNKRGTSNNNESNILKDSNKSSFSMQKIQGLENYNIQELKSSFKSDIKNILEDNDIYDVDIVDIDLHGSRLRGTAKADSDLDVVVQYNGDIREDTLFDILNENPIEIDGIKIDINPIQENINDYMSRSNNYDNEILSKNSTDNKGRKLSKEQQNYFKDSKVRDNNGNLITVYHGTPTGGFTIYDISRLGKTTKAKDAPIGIHFTDNLDMANQFKDFVSDEIKIKAKEEIDKKYDLKYGIAPFDMIAKLNQETKELAEQRVRENGEVKEQYLNIKKPMSIFADYGISEQQLADDLVYIATGEKNIANVSDYFEDNLDMLSAVQQNLNNELAELKDELAKPDAIKRFKELGYDGLILPIQTTDKLGLAELNLNTKGNEYIVFNSNQAKNVDNMKPTSNDDIRYSKNNEEWTNYLNNNFENIDNKGRKLSKQQQEYFKDSKVRDENGNLKEVYHGSNTKDITIFDIGKSNEDNVFGRGFYFTDNKLMAESYSEEAVEWNDGEPYVYKNYLNIKKPFVINGEQTQDLANKIIQTDNSADIIDKDYGVASTEKMTEWLINNGYDGIEINLKNSEDGKYYIVFDSNQIKNVNNTNPTDNPDIRYSKDNQTWQEYLEDNYKATGTRTNLKEINFPTAANIERIEKKQNTENKVELPKTKQDLLDNNSKALNQYIQEKNNTIRNIESQINEYNKKLNSIQDKNSVEANKIKSKLIELNQKQNDVEALYNKKIDKAIEKGQKLLNTPDMSGRKAVIQKNRELARERIENIGKWKDKSNGLKYQRETMERNMFDIIPNKKEAQKMIDTYFEPIHESEANKQRFINKYNDKIKELNLNKYESEAVQLLGEEKYNPDFNKDNVSEVLDRVTKNINDGKVDKTKVEKAIETFRGIYDELFDLENQALKENGYPEKPYRKGYFPHFVDAEPISNVEKFLDKFGFKVDRRPLPTDIAGITEQFVPGKTWNRSALRRKTDTTTYNALKGFDTYISQAADNIFHTDNIQKLRALENEIRYQYSDEGIKARIDEVYNNDVLTQDEQQAAIEKIFEQVENPMPNLVTELRRYTNGLANKKSEADRSAEQRYGRQLYSTVNAIENRFGANAVGLNIGSALTNFIPITQAYSQVSTKNMGRAVVDTIKSYIDSDGFVDSSTFLTNRLNQSEKLYKTSLEKISDKTSFLFNAIDDVTSNIVVRGKYLENLDSGMSVQEAMKNADRFGANVMADRSKGAMPTLFNEKSPITKAFTQFQLEVNNQYSYMFKDLPRDMKDKGVASLALAFFKMFIAAFLYNKASEEITGRKPAFSPIDIAIDAYKTFSDENTATADKIINVGKDIAEELPFVGGYLGGGRIPVSGALPDAENTFKAATGLVTGEMDSNKALSTLGKELSKPAYYLVPPFAGGQLKKTTEGVSTVSKGGSYSVDSKGNETLQFPVENANAGDYVKAGLFGKYALDNAKEYANRGYKSLNAKQTQIYKEAKIPYKELLDYIDQGLTSKEDKISYIDEQDLNENQKWGIYKYDIISNTERKDGGSQLSDAEYMINNGMTKNQYINMYNTAQKYNIDIPTEEEYNSLKQKGISINHYMDYKVKEKQYKNENGVLKDKDKIQILINSNYSNKEIKAIYEDQIKNTNDAKYNIMDKAGVDIKEYLKYKQQDFDSNKSKVYNYVNNMKINYNQKLLLLGMQYSLTSDEKTKLANYVNTMNISKQDKLDIYSKIKGFKVYDNGRVTW